MRAKFSGAPHRATGDWGPLRTIRRLLFTLRPEEVMTLILFVPVAYALAVIAANPSLYPVDPAAAGYPGALPRLIALAATVVIMLWIARVEPRWELIRDSLPFLFCANIYVSLHDVIRFYAFSDVTRALYRWDVALFGVEPTVWAQRFAQPLLTDVLTICYWLFYVTPPLLGLLLYRKGKRTAFRYTLLSIVLCLYLGYIGYVAWPASAPRLIIGDQYGAPLHGLWPLLDQTRAATRAIPLTARGAFPSLHCAVALLAVILAWRHLRWFFPIQLVLATGLIIGTVYLRHHWVVDILAGFVLTFASLWAGPRLERWWEKTAERYVPARALARANIDSGARTKTGLPSGSPAS
ncbi:MAG TPA: phosphatase PAP2 family protein [Candidatus Limnocylindrales bacterium]|nr:phosphatase PAP2 family protein [Candidatus Limnocylindrales bacterium]